jgi:hypothetical protein
MDCCGNCVICPFAPKVGDGTQKNVTVGRKKRKRKKGAGSGVKVKGHTRSPRGPNAGKRRVRVDGHARGKGAAGKRRGRRKRR